MEKVQWFAVITRTNDGHVHAVLPADCKDRAIQHAVDAYGYGVEGYVTLSAHLEDYGTFAKDGTRYSVVKEG